MKVGELRTLAKGASPDALLNALGEAYKKVPKDKKDELDAILVPIFGGAVGKPVQPAKPKPPKVNLDQLEEDVNDFTDNAYDGNYYYTNKKVSKANRSKWRFKVMNFLKTLDSIPEDDPDYDRVAELYITLYNVLSRGHIEHLYHGDEPFRSIGYQQGDLLERMVSANLSVDQSPDTLYALIHAVCKGCPNPENTHWDLQDLLLPYLDTEELQETALEQAMELSEEYIQRLGKEPTYHFMTTCDSIEDDDCAEHLAEMVLQIAFHISTERYLSTLDFYYDHCYERDHEIALYRALDVVDRRIYDAKEENQDTRDLEKAWMACYEDALGRGISPRKQLQEQYAKYKG